jgi:nucleoid-associated protein YgaU
MSVNTKKLYQSSFLAAAVASLSACTSTPHIPGMDMVADGLYAVTDKTVELSSNAWEGTKDILNIGPQNTELLDEVDLALLEPDAPNLLNDQGVVVSGVQSIDSNGPLLPMDNNDLAMQSPAAAQPLDASSDIVVAENGFQPQDLPAVDAIEAVASAELVHEVSESETLWEIAKSTTGDANNWHILADINNLMPNASVYPGQKLIIPADMVKPGYLDSLDDAATEQTVVALNVPKKPAAAQAEQIAAVEPKVETDNAATAFEAAMADNSTHMEVGPNESLWDFSKRTTGDATNWKLLAKVNQFSDSQATGVWPGQKILVPTDMIVERDADGVIIAKNAMGGSMPAATNDELKAGEVVAVIEELPADAADATAADATAAVLAGTNQPANGDIKIVEAAFQSDASIEPVTEAQLAEEAAIASATPEGGLGTVMIKGTYYPKGIYNSADFEGGLLMRVSPGTELVVSKAIGPWLEVQTEKGVGYVHNRDVK